jgi:UDP-4-amino-4,6-dideoxy-N-acetyl-beta-L-altrosamine N-acetyltransferase
MNRLGLLRGIAEREIDLMRSWRNEPSVRANMYTRHEISPEEHASWWDAMAGRPDCKYFMYEFSGVPCGIAAFTGIDVKNNHSAWAFYTAPGASRGSGSRMEFLMLEHAFGELHLHKLYCEVLAFNTAVIKLHQKFGFRIEGVFRGQHQLGNGYVDIVRLGIFADEWKAGRDAMLERLQARMAKDMQSADNQVR